MTLNDGLRAAQAAGPSRLQKITVTAVRPGDDEDACHQKMNDLLRAGVPADD